MAFVLTSSLPYKCNVCEISTAVVHCAFGRNAFMPSFSHKVI